MEETSPPGLVRESGRFNALEYPKVKVPSPLVILARRPSASGVRVSLRRMVVAEKKF
jgi:hypothetical protein